MKTLALASVLLFIGSGAIAQSKRTTVLKPANVSDSSQMHKIIPAEIPQTIMDSLQKKSWGIQDVSNAQCNTYKTIYVVEITHDIVKEIYWFDPKGHQLRPSAEKGNN